jgi:hypothetical protein
MNDAELNTLYSFKYSIETLKEATYTLTFKTYRTLKLDLQLEKEVLHKAKLALENAKAMVSLYKANTISLTFYRTIKTDVEFTLSIIVYGGKIKTKRGMEKFPQEHLSYEVKNLINAIFTTIMEPLVI